MGTLIATEVIAGEWTRALCSGIASIPRGDIYDSRHIGVPLATTSAIDSTWCILTQSTHFHEIKSGWNTHNRAATSVGVIIFTASKAVNTPSISTTRRILRGTKWREALGFTTLF